jgi:bifunctional non-homologous end joining protein LigD
MALEAYNQKRDFERTPEPPGAPAKGSLGPLRFTVQKHAATRLHYDFRIELDGVLVSWAVPKGPSMNPEEKKLAMKVEDHPLDYRDFEGIIPEGNYGAGTVMLWDEGVYHVPEETRREDIQKAVRQGLAKGDLKLFLMGHKLRGVFKLIKMKSDEENAWLMMKYDDQYVTEGDVLEQERSVKSGLSMDEIRERKPDEWHDTRIKDDSSGIDLSDAPEAKMPTDIDPMKAQLADEPFDRPGWLFELKWDGFRAIAEMRPGSVRLYSRNQQNYEEEFPPVFDDLKRLSFEAVLDGEVVVIDENGHARFQLLQNYRKTGEGTLLYYVFDILYLNGHDLRQLPLRRRKEILRQVLPDLPHIRYSDHIEEHGSQFYELALRNGLEGILAKEMNSTYSEGTRSRRWLKIKITRQQEAVIGGFTAPRGSRKKLGALLLGVYEDDDLVFIGHTGGGLDDKQLADLYKRLEPSVRKTHPFKKKPQTNQPATWVTPKLVVEVRFAEWTSDGLMRQPIYAGLRQDKDPREVKRERPVPVTSDPALSPPVDTDSPAAREQEPAPKGQYQTISKKKAPRKLPAARRRQTSDETITVSGRELTLTNQDKLYWPDGITKGDMVNYYLEMERYILPYLTSRPLALHRFPNGISGKSFFQKNVEDAPDWVRTEPVESESRQEAINYLVCDDAATLVYVANLGSIELHPWNSSIGSLDKPDYFVFDLDPGQQTFEDVIQVALRFHDILEEIEVVNLVKTTGKSGLHIYIPLGAQYSYEQVRQYAEIISRLVHFQLPKITTLERSANKRGGRMYLDILQNRRGQTLAAPYSLRPVPGATVSTPLQWSEVKTGLKATDYNMETVRPRVAELGDIWKDVLGPGVDFEKTLEQLNVLWKKIQKKTSQ